MKMEVIKTIKGKKKTPLISRNNGRKYFFSLTGSTMKAKP